MVPPYWTAHQLLALRESFGRDMASLGDRIATLGELIRQRQQDGEEVTALTQRRDALRAARAEVWIARGTDPEQRDAGGAPYIAEPLIAAASPVSGFLSTAREILTREAPGLAMIYLAYCRAVDRRLDRLVHAGLSPAHLHRVTRAPLDQPSWLDLCAFLAERGYVYSIDHLRRRLIPRAEQLIATRMALPYQGIEIPYEAGLIDDETERAAG